MVRVGIAANDLEVAANTNGWHLLSAVGGLAGVLHYLPSRRREGCTKGNWGGV